MQVHRELFWANLRSGESTPTLLHLVASFNGSGATDKRDLIYAALDFAARNADCTIAVGNRKTGAQVYGDFARYAMKHCGNATIVRHISDVPLEERMKACLDPTPDVIRSLSVEPSDSVASRVEKKIRSLRRKPHVEEVLFHQRYSAWRQVIGHDILPDLPENWNDSSILRKTLWSETPYCKHEIGKLSLVLATQLVIRPGWKKSPEQPGYIEFPPREEAGRDSQRLARHRSQFRSRGRYGSLGEGTATMRGLGPPAIASSGCR
ncbi:hypothetical protein BBP40_011895 [Aspergillus hancockii]|nr:hypothetical protein BBP40_011895 [Aspergillus hancockii]